MKQEKKKSNLFGRICVWILGIIGGGAILLMVSYAFTYGNKDLTTCKKVSETDYSTITSTARLYSKDGILREAIITIEEKFTSNQSMLDTVAEKYEDEYDVEVEVNKNTDTLKFSFTGDVKEDQQLEETIQAFETDGYTCEK